MQPKHDVIKYFLSYNKVLVPHLHKSVHRLWGWILVNRSIRTFRPLGCTVAHTCHFLKTVSIVRSHEIRCSTALQSNISEETEENFETLCLRQNSISHIVISSFQADSWPGHIVFYSEEDLHSGINGKMWPCTDYDMESLWEWETDGKSFICLTFATQFHFMERVTDMEIYQSKMIWLMY